MPPVPQAVVRTIPDPAASLSTSLPMRDAFSACPKRKAGALIDELIAHATQRQFVYTHRWRVHDLVMWDERCTMHHGTEFDDLRWKRDLQRATVCDVQIPASRRGSQAA